MSWLTVLTHPRDLMGSFKSSRFRFDPIFSKELPPLRINDLKAYGSQTSNPELAQLSKLELIAALDAWSQCFSEFGLLEGLFTDLDKKKVRFISWLSSKKNCGVIERNLYLSWIGSWIDCVRVMLADKKWLDAHFDDSYEDVKQNPNKETGKVDLSKGSKENKEHYSPLADDELESLPVEADPDQLKFYEDVPDSIVFEDDDLVLTTASEESDDEGRYAYKPVSINNSYSNGYLYYPVQTVHRSKQVIGKGSDKKEVMAEAIETVVVRSDRQILHFKSSEKLNDSETGTKVYRLTDGTLVNSIPTANEHGTWSWDYINTFVNDEVENLPSLDRLIEKVRDVLYGRIWLPSECDYYLLALTAVTSYVQSVFDAVPLLLLTGPAGSGKSELSTAMTQVSANAVMIGQVSAPTMMRLIDSSGGLCVIDDLESVGVSPNSKNGQQKFSEIAQVLKVSYKKSSATRMVTNVKTMRTEVLNFFGCKIISNTKGVDDILGSRMIHIHTRHMPSEVMPTFKVREQFSDDDTYKLRNLLHTWAFTHVNEVHKTYRAMYTSKSNRQDEIAAPLRVLAKMSGNQEIIVNLEQSLSLQTRRKRQKQNPEDVLFDVSQRLIGYGYREVATTHIMMELRRELDPGYHIDYSKEMPGWSKKEWIGRKLREMGIVESAYNQRKRLLGSNLRLIKFTEDFVKKTLAKNPGPELERKTPVDFCTDCASCPYRNHQCELMALKANAERSVA